MSFSIANFHVIRPRFSARQQSVLEWVAHAHAYAEALKNKWDVQSQELTCFYEEIKERLMKIGCGPDKIKTRGMQSSDFTHTNWNEMDIFRLEEAEEGRGLKTRKDFFNKELDTIFNAFYPDDVSASSHLIHVTCTGYAAPSGAQRLVSRKGWGDKTVVTHAYHMGCYASFPALRMARGFLSQPSSEKNSVDIVHTEMCSLHFNPILHTQEQLVVQTLFSDGFIKYAVMPSEVAHSLYPDVLDILSLHEEIIPASSESMTWGFENWGMRMTIAKEVPVLIKRHLKSFIKRLIEKANLNPEDVEKKALYAIHPGGPKIVQQVADILNLTKEHVAHSQSVLEDYGNMSSGTLPHVWDRIVKDAHIKKGSLMIALAFGPGLSMSGGLFKKGG